MIVHQTNLITPISMADKTLNGVKRELRQHGMRECYTRGGCNIIYCGSLAIRLINEYTVETWNPHETESGTIVHYDSIADKNNAVLAMGLEALGVI